MKFQNNSYRNIFSILKEFRLLTFFTSVLICFAYGLFSFISYQNYKNIVNQRYLNESFFIANTFEIFLSNVFRQAEYIGYKIEKANSTSQRNQVATELSKHHLSLNVDLDTSLIGDWINFQLINKNKINNFKEYDLSASKLIPWEIHFGPLNTSGANPENSYIPISFGIASKKGNYIGSLISKINISNLVKYFQYNVKDKNLSIVVLDNENNIIVQPFNQSSLPPDFFKNVKLRGNSGKIYKKYDLNDVIYISYKKLDFYPFTVIVGDNRKIIFDPLKDILIKYLLLLFFVLLAFIFILLCFYKKIINPVIELSYFAKDIITSKQHVKFNLKKHFPIEIQNLANALIKIEDLKNRILFSTKRLKDKSRQLELIKCNLELDLKKLFNAYLIRDELNKDFPKDDVIIPQEIIKRSLDLLYPEIYSRQLKVSEFYTEKEEIKLNISYEHFMNIVVALLIKSFTFSKKNGQIQIKTELLNLDEIQYFCLMIEDDGIGEENWRIKNSKNSDFDKVESLIEKYKGNVHLINKEEGGVKYCVMFPLAKITSLENLNNVILFPSK